MERGERSRGSLAQANGWPNSGAARNCSRVALLALITAHFGGRLGDAEGGVAPPSDESPRVALGATMSLGITEIIIAAAIVLVLFGSKAIPKLARSLGSVRHEFEAGQRVDSEQ